MKKILVIGSTVVDVIIDIDHLPKTQEDVHVIRQQMSLGGCAYNTSDMIRHFQVPYILFSPVGTGAYGDFVRTRLDRRGILSPIPTPDRENGCCYCFVEKNGERTFISYHGAEYLFEPRWFDLLDQKEIHSVYICGLEIEETTGANIVSWLEANASLPLYFAPGPRIGCISGELLHRLFRLHPILHLNREEAVSYAEAQTGRTLSLEEAAEYLFGLTGSTVIVTLGKDGAFCRSADGAEYIPGVSAIQRDTIGAGDSHIGAVMACRYLGMDFRESIRRANLAAAKVVETKGALLSDEDFRLLNISDDTKVK